MRLSYFCPSGMSPLELRASLGLAGLYALLMLGMFLTLPVFVLEAQHLPGGDHPVWVGLAFGIYGLTRALVQLPSGMLSDHIGRKRVIYIGLSLFSAGSFLSALAPNIEWLIAGRALQGVGAASAAIMALLADLTSEEHRTRAMAMIGGSIGVTFAVSMVAAPGLAQAIGLSGIFALTGVLGLLAMLATWLLIPDPKHSSFHSDTEANPQRLAGVLKHPQLLRLNYGVFALHTAQMALFTTLPLTLQTVAGLAPHEHWKLYLPVMLLGFVLMLPAVIVGETRNRLKQVFLGAIALMLLAQMGLALAAGSMAALLGWMTVYFVAFNILEATQPSLISKLAPAEAKGTAMGVYNSTQSFGLFVGGVLGGMVFHHFGAPAVYQLCALLMVLWLLLSLGLTPPLPVRTMMYHVDTAYLGDSAGLARQLAALQGVKEAVVIAEERVAYLKVMRDGWDEPAALRLVGHAT